MHADQSYQHRKSHYWDETCFDHVILTTGFPILVRGYIIDIEAGLEILKILFAHDTFITLPIIFKPSTVHGWDTAVLCVNTLRPRQNCRHLPNDIVKCISLNENVWISIEISLKFVRKSSINNIPALVQIMAWRRPGDKPLSEPMMASLLTHICVTRPQWVKVHNDWANEIDDLDKWDFVSFKFRSSFEES